MGAQKKENIWGSEYNANQQKLFKPTLGLRVLRFWGHSVESLGLMV